MRSTVNKFIWDKELRGYGANNGDQLAELYAELQIPEEYFAVQEKTHVSILTAVEG